MQTNMVSYAPASRLNANAGAQHSSHRAGHRQNNNLKFGFVEPVSCSTVALGCCAVPCVIPLAAIITGLAVGIFKLISYFRK